MVGIKYAIKMSRFIKKLKEFPYQYLQQSVIIVKDKTTQAFVNDANVTIKLNHRETSEIIGPLTLTNLSGLEPLSLNEYDIDLVLTETGIWDLFIDIQIHTYSI